MQIPILKNGSYIASTAKGILKSESTRSLHYHECHQLLIISNGVSLLIEEDEQQPLYGTMCAFIPADCLHRTTVIGDPISYNSLYFRRELFDPHLLKITLFTMSNLASSLLARIAATKFTEYRDEISSDCLKLLFKIVAEDITKKAPSLRLPQPQREETKKIVSYLEEHYKHKIELQKLQSVLPYSRRHITRIFKDDLKITIFEYLKIYRLFKISVMLHDVNKTVTEAVFGCGYESLTSFYMDFKKYFNTTPKKFRNRVCSQLNPDT